MKKTKKMLSYYYGKPVTELNRKELLECIEEISKEIGKYKDDINLMGNDYYELLAEKKLGLR